MKRKQVTRMLVLSGVVTLATGRGSAEAAANEAAAAGAEGAPIKIAVEANSQFAFDLYAELAKRHEGENLFFSPHSISNALLMAAEGARGHTAKEMGTVLGFPKELQRVGRDAQRIPWEMARLRLGQAELNRRLDRGELSPEQEGARAEEAALEKQLEEVRAKADKLRGGEDRRAYFRARDDERIAVNKLNAVRKTIDTLELAVANALWGEQSYPFEKEWHKTVTSAYDADAVQAVDFRNNAERERQRINAWVEEKTNKRIVNLLPPRSVDKMTRLVIVNAIYFKAEWESPFKPQNTKDRKFTLVSGDTVEVPIMTQGGARERPLRRLPGRRYALSDTQARSLERGRGHLPECRRLPGRRAPLPRRAGLDGGHRADGGGRPAGGGGPAQRQESRGVDVRPPESRAARAPSQVQGRDELQAEGNPSANGNGERLCEPAEAGRGGLHRNVRHR